LPGPYHDVQAVPLIEIDKNLVQSAREREQIFVDLDAG
jgi:hypothetical protein